MADEGLGPFASHALGYVACDQAVFPVRERDKAPLVEGGFHAASRDEHVVAQWAERWPRANIGLPTGAVNGIVVLDADGPAAETGLGERGAAVPTRTSVTARGRQLFFAHPGQGVTVRCTTALRPALDVRGDGGYVVVPPSIHPSGHVYRWDDEHGMGWSLPLAPLPAAVLQALANGKAPRAAVAAIATRPTIPEGE